MSQFTLDPNPAVPQNGSAGEQPTPKPARRRRHSASRASAASRAEGAALAAEQPTAQPEAAPVPAAEQAATSAAQQPAPAAAEAATSAPKPRSQRPRRASARKNGVQLVKSAGAPASDATAAAAPGGEPETRAVPVTTEQAFEASAATAVPGAPQPRRYRFERRTPSSAATASARGERISGPLGATGFAEPAEAAPATPDVAPELEAQPTLATPPRERRDETTSDVLTDIVSLLGLQGSAASAGAAAPTEPTEHDVQNALEAEAAETDAESASAEAEQPGGTRRRRRRRRSAGHTGGAEDDAEAVHAVESAPDEIAATPYPEPEADTRNGYAAEEPYTYGYPGQQPYSPYSRAPRERATNEAPWDIATGQQRTRQPESPFASPEPSFARGFGPQPRGVAGPARETYPRTPRPERGIDVPPMSPNVLASTVTHAIQQQTDRLLNELRHQTNPPAMSVILPPLPSTERVGVFVDVANVLYSSRNLRINLDFGRLLDFLRGNRRLVRAHAYAPTDPDPRADQSFLNAVKGYGYRITTKNYKTFSSGAKKADMDLDLCMDIVRLVGAGALDTVSLVSGDSDFLPLLEYCSDHGVRVEVAAFEDSAAMILRQSCDVFINLSLVDDIRA